MTHWTGDTLDYRRQQLRNLSINVYPDSDKLAEALADIIKDYSWKTYTIVYDTDESKYEGETAYDVYVASF